MEQGLARTTLCGQTQKQRWSSCVRGLGRSLKFLLLKVGPYPPAHHIPPCSPTVSSPSLVLVSEMLQKQCFSPMRKSWDVSLSSTGLPGEWGLGELPGQCGSPSWEAWWLWRGLHRPGGEDHSEMRALAWAPALCLFVSLHTTPVVRENHSSLLDITWGFFSKEQTLRKVIIPIFTIPFFIPQSIFRKILKRNFLATYVFPMTWWLFYFFCSINRYYWIHIWHRIMTWKFIVYYLLFQVFFFLSSNVSI